MVSHVMSMTADVDGNALDLAAVVDRVRRSRLPDAPKRRLIREHAGVTVREMAVLVGVAPMTICRWEHGTTTPSPEKAARYREVLDALSEATRAAA